MVHEDLLVHLGYYVLQSCFFLVYTEIDHQRMKLELVGSDCSGFICEDVLDLPDVLVDVAAVEGDLRFVNVVGDEDLEDSDNVDDHD